MPCNFNQRELAQRVKAGIRAAGGTPMEFNTISISDGVTMGTEGMKASLVSRELIADSIELVVRGHLMDGLVCIVGCDKTIPAGVMALCRLDVPGLVLYNGTIAPGHVPRARHHHPGRVRGGRRLRRRQDRRRGAARGRVGRVPGRRRLRRPVHRQHHVDGARLPRHQPGGPERRSRRSTGARATPPRSAAGWRCSSCATTCAPRTSSPARRSRTRPPSVAATGGSTNGVLHLLAIARELDIPFSIDDFDEIAAPHADRGQPEAGRTVRCDGPLRRRRRRRWSPASCASASSCTPAPATSTGARMGEIADAGVETPGQPVVVPIETPLKPTGGLAILRGNLAPDGCVVKLAGHERRSHSGPARVFDCEEDCFAAVKAGAIKPGDVVVIRYEGPAGGPGHARDAARHRRDRGRGAGRPGRAPHRRPLLRRDARPDGRPRHARGGRTAARSRRSATATRSSSTSTPRELRVALSDDEIAARLRDWTPPKPRYKHRRASPSTRRSSRPRAREP